MLASFLASAWRRPLRFSPTLRSIPRFHTAHPQSPTLTLLRRNLSLFSRSPPPSPTTVAHITRLEAEANVYPHDVSKQLTLFHALLDTGLNPSYDVLISRWEKMCEFNPSSPLLHSPPAFTAYIHALLKSGQSASIPAAVRRRDSLLAAHPPPAPEQEPPSSDPNSPAPSLTSSQELAQAVLAGKPLPSPSSLPPRSLLDAANGSPQNPIQVTIVESKGAWVPKFLRFLVATAIFTFFLMVILSVFFENSGVMKTGPAASKFEFSDGKVYKFSDVHGVDEAKDELQDIVQFLKDPDSFSTLGGKLPKGVLLTGPPGTGKTLLARAVAGEAGVPFFLASGSDFEEMFVGVGAKRVRDLFAAARKKQPAIIFIDELDAVGGKRSSRDLQYMKQTLNQLLVEMDGFQQSDGVVVIAATNFPQSLDSALVRPGRFDRIVTVPLPDVRGRAQILKHHMHGIQVAKEVDLQRLARGTIGFSGADLQNMVNMAAIQASKEKAKAVALQHFEWAKDKIIMGAERRSQMISEKDKLATAYHEGGHALVALYTDGATPLHKVTCMPRGQTLGHTSFLPEADQTSVTFKQYLARIDVSLGGRVAEEIIYGADSVTSGASSDIVGATKVASAMVKEWGFSSLGPIYFDGREEISPQRLAQIEDEISKLIKGGLSRTNALLTSRKEELHRLAHALVEHETLDAEEVRKVIKGEKIRNIKEVLDEALSTSQPSSTS